MLRHTGLSLVRGAALRASRVPIRPAAQLPLAPLRTVVSTTASIPSTLGHVDSCAAGHSSAPSSTTRSSAPTSPSPSPSPSAGAATSTSTSPASPSSSPSSTAEGHTPTLPAKLSSYAPRLARLSGRTGVPLPSLLASFLVLHELTALVPLVLLFYAFGALGAGTAFLHWLHGVAKSATGEEDVEGPFAAAAHVLRGWYDEGAARVERVGRRYGILGYDKAKAASGNGDAVAVEAEGTVAAGSEEKRRREAASVVADAIAAYVVVKALMPVRIGVSVAAAPAFARTVFRPVQRAVARFRKPKL